MSTASRFVVITIRMLGGLLIWAAHFGLIYAVTALVCARGLDRGIVTWAIGIATLLALGGATALIVSGVRGLRRRRLRFEETPRFIDWMTAAFGAYGFLAVAWEAVPVLMIPTCA